MHTPYFLLTSPMPSWHSKKRCSLEGELTLITVVLFGAQSKWNVWLDMYRCFAISQISKDTDDLCYSFLFSFYQRLQKCLRAYGFDVIEQIMADVSHLCQVIVVSTVVEFFYGRSNFF